MTDLDPKTLERLEDDIEESIAEIFVKRGLKQAWFSMIRREG